LGSFFPVGRAFALGSETRRIVGQPQDAEKKAFSLGLFLPSSEADWNMMCKIQDVGNLLTILPPCGKRA
jgi:hypothetical protein